MRETPPQREITVPGDMRPSRAKAPARRASTARREAKPPPGELMASIVAAALWFGGLCRRRPAETAGSAVALAAALTISVNALGYQKGLHPAPILPQPKLPALANAQSAAPAPARSAPEPVRDRVALPEKAPVESAPRDAIGALIRSADDTTASVTPKPDKAVMQAQRALTKLGYGPLKDDGVIGPGTKAAIEKFEHDRKLPVTGEASGRTLKALSVAPPSAKPAGAKSAHAKG